MASAELHDSHTALANGSFWIKSRLLMAQRFARNVVAGESFHRYRRTPLSADALPLAHDEHRLYSATDPRERELEMGKVQNLRIAARAIDGVVLQAGETFSYWNAAGRATRRRGYVVGRELRQGCMIPTIGGGICQLTNALSRIAHKAGMEIVERHSHSVHPPGFFIDGTTDATVFWNYIDFRFRATKPVRIGAELTETTLVVRLDALP